MQDNGSALSGVVRTKSGRGLVCSSAVAAAHSLQPRNVAGAHLRPMCWLTEMNQPTHADARWIAWTKSGEEGGQVTSRAAADGRKASAARARALLEAVRLSRDDDGRCVWAATLAQRARSPVRPGMAPIQCLVVVDRPLKQRV